MASRLGVALAAFLLLAGTAQAQQYQRLHVRSFTLSSDTARPQLEQPFHVTLTIRVSENLAQLENVFLPTFFGAEELGDEQQITHGPGGTTYRETLTLVGHARGMLSVSPAYLDAIDARDGKAKRFVSNALQLPIGGGPIGMLRRTLRTAALAVIEVVLVAAAVFVLIALFRRRPRRPAEPAAAAPEVPPVVVDPPKNELAGALERLRARRDRSAVMSVRAALWHLAGATSGETLSDVLRRPAATDVHLRRLLLIVERAAFIEHARLNGAIDEVLSEREWTVA